MARILTKDFDLLPHSDEAEQAISGSLLLDPDALARVDEVGLAPTDFHNNQHGWILEAAQALARDGEPVDIISISRRLESVQELEGNRLDLVGGVVALGELATRVPSSAHVAYYATLVIRDARRRHLISAGAQITAEAAVHDGPLTDLYDKVSKELQDAMPQADQESHLLGGDGAIEWYRKRQQARADLLASDPDALIKTHWIDVDRRIGDFQPGQLVVIGAGTSVGKTMAMEQISEANAARGHRIAYYHLELSHQSMMDRCVARYSGIDTRRLRQGLLTAEVERALDKIRPWHRNITYIESPGWSAERLAADITRMHARGACDLAVVDYLQKVSMPDELKAYNYAQMVGSNVELLKNTAERLRIPIILGSQVNREYKGRANHRPGRADLRDSGEIEEKSNIILMLHNPTPPDERDETAEREVIELHIEKSTDGPLGMVKLVHLKGRFLLADYADEDTGSAPARRQEPPPSSIWDDDDIEDIPF